MDVEVWDEAAAASTPVSMEDCWGSRRTTPSGILGRGAGGHEQWVNHIGTIVEEAKAQ